MAAVKEMPAGRYIFYNSIEEAEADAVRLSKNDLTSSFLVMELQSWGTIPLSKVMDGNDQHEKADDPLNKLMKQKQ